MRALTELVTHGRVDVHVVRMVHSVHELRNGNWGQSTVNSTATESTELIDPHHAVDEPVFYGPDGKVLTAEENKFLEDVADIATSIDDNMCVHETRAKVETLPANVGNKCECLLQHIGRRGNLFVGGRGRRGRGVRGVLENHTETD